LTRFLHIVKGPLFARFLAVGLLCLGSGAASISDAVAGDKVEQPIEFPHDIHAGKMGINCMYCHTYARRSLVSGIPPLQKCIGCHQNIPSVRDKPRIKKLFEYWETKQPIPWKKVHDLPEFVRFSHERHIQRFYLLSWRCEDDDGRRKGEAADHGLVYILSPERSSGGQHQHKNQPRSQRLLAMPQMTYTRVVTSCIRGNVDFL